jgi:hypothetical protein
VVIRSPSHTAKFTTSCTRVLGSVFWVLSAIGFTTMTKSYHYDRIVNCGRLKKAASGFNGNCVS